MHRLLILTLTVLLLPGCGNEPKPKPIAPRSGGSSTSNVPKGPAHDWASMMDKVKNVKPRTEKILNLIEDAVSAHDKYKRTAKAGTPDESLKQKAIRLKQEAGDLLEMLQEEVYDAAPNSELGYELWDKRMGAFQRKYDRLYKKVRRIDF